MCISDENVENGQEKVMALNTQNDGYSTETTSRHKLFINIKTAIFFFTIMRIRVCYGSIYW
jgi:hypothetical protein